MSIYRQKIGHLDSQITTAKGAEPPCGIAEKSQVKSPKECRLSPNRANRLALAENGCNPPFATNAAPFTNVNYGLTAVIRGAKHQWPQ